MKFEEKINELINEAEIPDCLSPENIAHMLKQKTADKNKKPSVPTISIVTKKKTIAFRSTAAVAACIALVFGVTALVSDNGTALPIGYLESAGEVKEAENYSDVYKVMQDAYFINGKVIEDEQDIPYAHQIPNNDSDTPDKTGTPDTTTTDINAVIKYGITSESVEGVAEADIVKTDGNNLYYTANNSLYIVSATNGKMTILSKTQRENNYPVEMYIDNNRLIVISNNVVATPYEINPVETTTPVTEVTSSTDTDVSETTGDSSASTQSSDVSETTITTSGTTAANSKTSSLGTDTSAAETIIPSTILQSNTIVEIYDISDKATPKLVTTYKQSGLYISSRMVESSLYLVTNYSKYQTKPLQNQDDLENYVPAYYINDVKTYVEAKDICIPSKVSSTSYAIISGLNIQNENPMTSIKAVLGNAKNIYSSVSNLYVIGNLPANKDKDCSSITQFKINKGTVTYSANASIEGTLINQISMGEFDNSFRMATTTTDTKTGKYYSNIFILGIDLKPIGSSTKRCENETVKTVRFDNDAAYLVTAEGKTPVSISLADKTNPKKAENKVADNYSAYLHKYSDNRLIGIGAELDENGKQTGLKLSMFDSTKADAIKEISSISLSGKLSDSLIDEVINRKALLIDTANNVIGIPTVSSGEYGTKNLYYVFSYDDTNGFVQKGFLEYNDVAQKNYEFNRGLLVGDVFYAFSNGRIVSAQLSDIKVIEVLSLK